MSAQHIPCGPFANESERTAVEYLKSRLNGALGGQKWVLLTNLCHVADAWNLADEVDLVAVGPPGVRVVEVKHWDGAFLRTAPPHITEGEAHKLNAKTKRIKGCIERACSLQLPFLEGALLLTRGEASRYREDGDRRRIAGVPLFGLTEWKELLEVEQQRLLSDADIDRICRVLAPGVEAALTGDIRAFGSFVDLERVVPKDDAFHRIYRGRRRPSQDRVVVHIYDLSATSERDPASIARREYDTLQRLQKSRWLPSLMDSFQESPNYPGELCFFSYVEPEAAPLSRRATDGSWTLEQRLAFAVASLGALHELHSPPPGADATATLHRNLNPETIRVRSTDEPIFTGLHLARLTDASTIAGRVKVEFPAGEEYVAPEVRSGGLGACTAASDVFSLCASLARIFLSMPDATEPSASAVEILRTGQAEDPAGRPAPSELRDRLRALGTPPVPAEPEAAAADTPGMAVQYWDEDMVLRFRERYYRIVTRFGSGGVGTTFKVMEVDSTGKRELSGPYVAKAITNATVGPAATQAYARVRGQTGRPHLAGVLEVTGEWAPDQITALLYWIEGDPLSDWMGVLPLYLEEQNATDPEAVVLHWLRTLCRALTSLHRAGLVHGDVSPKNIIVSGLEVTLTDFDLSVPAGEIPLGRTDVYCSPSVDRRDPISPSDDVYSLAASLFHVLFDRPPFEYPTGRDKARGLFWEGLDREPWPRLARFLDRASHPDAEQRFQDADAALAFLDTLTSGEPPEPVEAPAPVLSDNKVPWLAQLLQSYPGSQKGNVETRGLDSKFAKQTYVETELDSRLAEAIRKREVSLVILCGNAGDGKTALLQYLAGSLGLEPGHSAGRVWDETLSDGLRIRANLDGSAAYRGRSAQELLDEFFAPFMRESFPPDLVHLLAINDGPLFAWLEGQDETPLTRELDQLLEWSDWQGAEGRIRFIDLNTRSLVGGVHEGRETISTEFLDELLEKLLGEGEDQWAPCVTCSAQDRCHARRSVRTLRDPERGPIIRTRLARAFQAVHHRGEVHITARSLRAALVYIFFGTQYCLDLHENQDLSPPGYWDRAFDGSSEDRQGELLEELKRLDPGLDAHPLLDRELLRVAGTGRDGSGLDAAGLRSLRRRAYFEWSDEEIRLVAHRAAAVDLTGMQHLAAFQRVATATEEARQEICDRLCEGLSRLEDLPDQAYRGDSWPLKITPRTPTETAFWVSKPKHHFSLKADIPRPAPGLDVLPTHLQLTYRLNNGHDEVLRINAALFHLLREAGRGFQVSDAQSDDVFANLSIFKQRLAQEDAHILFAWNPTDERVFRIAAELDEGIQKLVIRPEERG